MDEVDYDETKRRIMFWTNYLRETRFTDDPGVELKREFANQRLDSLYARAEVLFRKLNPERFKNK